MSVTDRFPHLFDPPRSLDELTVPTVGVENKVGTVGDSRGRLRRAMSPCFFFDDPTSPPTRAPV
jgi:hypothetical protein